MTENHECLANISIFKPNWAWSFQEDGTLNIKRFRRVWNACLATCGQAFKIIFYETWPLVAISQDEIHAWVRAARHAVNPT
jgi:hypothetical protein